MSLFEIDGFFRHAFLRESDIQFVISIQTRPYGVRPSGKASVFGAGMQRFDMDWAGCL